ncbi:MAG: hypothetical protein GY803_17005 [Chloroflexi bacterium]|nr:hypothetical protein [Chloroflexota bacterium]
MNKRFTFYVLRFTSAISRHKFQAAALAIAFAAAWPLLAGPGLLNTRGGGDSPFLLQRLQQLETAVLQGHFPVRWMPDANYGYGYPFFNYYAPLSIYITLVFRLVGFSYVRSIQLAQLAGFLTAAWGMFRLGQRWFKSDWAGLLAAAAYTVAPFHMVNVYTRGDSLAEFWAMAFYPLVILAASGKFASNKFASSQVALLALAYAGLILSHNISAMIFSPFLLLYIFLRRLRRPLTITRSQLIINYLFALLLAFALAAWFFVPALAEQPSAQLGPVTEGYFHFSVHFRRADLVQTGFFFDYNPDGGVAFRMGLVQAITAVLGIIVLLIYKNGARITRKNADISHSPAHPLTRSPAHLFIALSFLIATFMITPLSQALWEHLPLLSFTQFPWRFLSVQAFAGALATAVLALLPWKKWLVPATAVLLLASSLGNLQTDHLILTDADITAEKLVQYEWFTGNIGTTISAEYLPQTVQPRPYTSSWLTTGERDIARALSGELVVAQRTNEQMTRQIWEVETAVPSTLIFPTLHWPGWVGEINGERAAIRPSPGSGLITLDVPSGEHTIALRFTRTPLRLAAELASLIAVFVTLWALKPRPTRFSKPRRSHAVALLFLVLLAVGLRLWPERALPPNDLTWDFAQMGYLHHDETIQFSNGAILAGYAISQEEVIAGRDVAIALNWQTGSDSLATLALTTPVKPRQPQVALLVEQSQPIQTGTTTHQLAIPENAPPGLYVPRLLLENGRALMPSGKTRGELYLRPIRVVPSSVIHYPPSDGLDVRAVEVERRGNVLDMQLAWFTPYVIGQNYNVSLRLLDGNGMIFSQFDAQPGYGFLPSGGWPVNEWVNDWLMLRLTVPAPSPDNAPHALTAALYDAATGEAILIRRLGELDESLTFRAQEPIFALPDKLMGETAVFQTNTTPLIQLEGYVQQADTLTLYWRSLAKTAVNYTRFVHLVDLASGNIIAQVDGYAQGDSYPTSQWQPNEIIADAVPNLPAGDYVIFVGFYENLGNAWPRLTAVAPNGSSLPDNRVSLGKFTIDD